MTRRIAGIVFEQVDSETVDIIAMKHGGKRIEDAGKYHGTHAYVFPDRSVMSVDSGSSAYCAGWDEPYGR